MITRILKLQNQLYLVMIDLWHQRLAHVNLKQLRQLVECSDGIDVQSQSKLSFCEACAQGKCH